MDKEVELILKKLKIVSEEQERGLYLCDKEHSKLLLDYITNLQQENERIKKMNMHEHKYGSDMEEKYLIEKTKNDRAVEYIQNCPEYLWENVNTKELLNILNGRSDE